MSTTAPVPTPLLAFLGGEGADGAGRTLDEVLSLDDAALERHHDFIQWLFPLTERSAANPDAPILTAADVDAIRTSPALQAAIERALIRMTAFYGRTDHWLTGCNHNHLRITRIIRSVGLLLGPEPAERFFDQICERESGAAHPVSPRSRRYWQDALAEVQRQERKP